MPKLPVSISGMELIKIIVKLGYDIDHQTGSHIILRQKEEPYRRITVPKHSVMAKGTLRAIIRQLGLSNQGFTDLLKK